MGGLYTLPLGINNGALVVGSSALSSQNPGSLAAFVYDGAMHDLNSLIPLNSGWFLDDANSINDAGQIISSGHTTIYPRRSRAFLLTPCLFQFSSLNAREPLAGGGASLTVLAPNGCSWSASTATPWLTAVSGAGGNGAVVVTFNVEPNPGLGPRTGAITIAGQRIKVTQAGLHVPGDINGDGRPDLVLQNTSTRQVAAWFLDRANGVEIPVFHWLSAASVPGWTVVAVTDLNGDGHPDVILQNDSTSQLAAWFMGGPNGDRIQSFDWIASFHVPGWRVAGMADLNLDGHPDVILQNVATGQVAAWLMGGPNGDRIQSFSWIAAFNLSGWNVAGFGDINGDGHPDIILQNTSTGQVAAGLLGGAAGTDILAFHWIASFNVPEWVVQGAMDLDDDGHPDIILQNTGNGAIAAWLLGGVNGDEIQSVSYFTVLDVPGWRFIVPQ